MQQCISESDSEFYYILLLIELGVFGIFAALCVFSLFYLLYAFRGVMVSQWDTLLPMLFMLFLSFANRFFKLLYNVCALEVDNIIHPLVWSSSYFFEATSLGLFVLQWDSTLRQVSHSSSGPSRKCRYLVGFSGLGLLCSIASFVGLLMSSSPLTSTHEVVVTIANCAAVVLGIVFSRISCTLHRRLTNMIAHSIDANDPVIVARAQSINQVLVRMRLAGFVVTVCYLLAAALSLIYFFLPSLNEDVLLFAGLRPALYNLCLCSAFATMFVVLQPSIVRVAADGERARLRLGQPFLIPDEETNSKEIQTSGALPHSSANSFTGIQSANSRRSESNQRRSESTNTAHLHMGSLVRSSSPFVGPSLLKASGEL